MRLPQFLIIGAMKSGTTGLFFDIGQHPGVFLPDDKEPHALCSDEVLTEQGKSKYAALFSGAHDDQLVGEASTGYTKLPDRSGVVPRATQVLPAGFRAIYIVRDPIDRIISQHYHEYSRGLVGSDINAEVRAHSRFVDFSRYAWQLEPWLEAIGRKRIHLVRFEDYKANRQRVVAECCEFLGLDPAELPTVEADKVYNAGDGKPVLNSFWKSVRENPIYKACIKPLVSSRARHHIRKWFMPKAPERPAPPSDETIRWLSDELADDQAEFDRLYNAAPKVAE